MTAKELGTQTIMTEKAKELGKEVITGVYRDIPYELNCGLSKREYFAIQMMKVQVMNNKGAEKHKLAHFAICDADALLEELCKDE